MTKESDSYEKRKDFEVDQTKSFEVIHFGSSRGRNAGHRGDFRRLLRTMRASLY